MRLGYGVRLCELTWYNTMAEFPDLRVGIVYMPIPLGGLLTLLFLIEKVWVGEPPKSDVMYTDQAAELAKTERAIDEKLREAERQHNAERLAGLADDQRRLADAATRFAQQTQGPTEAARVPPLAAEKSRVAAPCRNPPAVEIGIETTCDPSTTSKASPCRDDGQIDLVAIVAGPGRTARVTPEASSRRSPSLRREIRPRKEPCARHWSPWS